MKRLFLRVLICLGLISWFGLSALDAQTNVSPTDQRAVERFCAFYQKTQAFQVKAKQTIRVDRKETERLSLQLILKRPAQARLSITNAESIITETVVSGTSVVSYDSKSKRIRTLTGNLPPLSEMLGANCAVLGTVGAADVRKQLMEGVVSFKVGNNETVNGRGCFRLELFGKDTNKTTCWIDSGMDPRLLRVLSQEKKEEGAVETETVFSEWSFSPTVAAGAFVFVPPSGARELKPEFRPKNKEPVLHAKIEIPASAFAESAYTSRDLIRRQRDWAERMMLKPFWQHLAPDQPWSNDALGFVQEAAMEWAEDPMMEDARVTAEQQPSPEDPVPLLCQRGVDLINNGCDDPLVLFLTNHLRYRMKDYSGFGRNAENAFVQLEGSKIYPRAVALLAGLYADLILAREGKQKQRDTVDKRIPDLAIESLNRGDYAGKDDFLFLFHILFFSNYLDKESEAFSKVCGTPVLPEWEQQTLLGIVELNRGGKERGGQYPHVDRLSLDQATEFEKHYALARDAFTKAWKLRPDRPEAASAMISVTMAGSGNPGDTLQLWFDRAIAAQFDYLPAYHNLVQAYSPQWGGTREAMLAIGDACAGTNRFDTKVPLMIHEAIKEVIWISAQNRRKLYEDPARGPLAVAVSKKCASDPLRAFEWRRRTAYLALHAFLAGDLATSLEAFKKLNHQFSNEIYDEFNRFGVDPQDVNEELAARFSPTGEAYLAAEKLFFEKKSEAATLAYEALAGAGDSPTLEIARKRLEALKLEKQLATGQWMQMPTMGWETKGGEWVGSPEGILEPKNSFKPTLAIAPPRLGNSFEVRADVQYTPPTTRDGNGMMVALGFTRQGTSFATCGFFLPPGERTGFVSRSSDFGYDPQSSSMLPVEDHNRFWIQVWNGEVTFFFNGVKVAQNAHAFSPDWTQGRVGFCNYDVIKGVAYRVSNVQVRLLKEPPKAPAAEDLLPQTPAGSTPL